MVRDGKVKIRKETSILLFDSNKYCEQNTDFYGFYELNHICWNLITPFEYLDGLLYIVFSDF